MQEMHVGSLYLVLKENRCSLKGPGPTVVTPLSYTKLGKGSTLEGYVQKWMHLMWPVGYLLLIADLGTMDMV